MIKLELAKQADMLIKTCNTQSCKNFVAEIKEANTWLEKAEPYKNKNDEKSKTKHRYYESNAMQVFKKVCASFKKLNTKDTTALAKKVDYDTLENNLMEGCPMLESGFLELMMGLDSANTKK